MTCSLSNYCGLVASGFFLYVKKEVTAQVLKGDWSCLPRRN